MVLELLLLQAIAYFSLVSSSDLGLGGGDFEVTSSADFPTNDPTLVDQEEGDDVVVYDRSKINICEHYPEGMNKKKLRYL